MRRLVFLISLATLWLINAATIQAAPPAFPLCANPRGEIIANYSSGTHGIAGDPKTYTGADVVYKVSDTEVLQCFCPADGKGIQTNWWKVPGLSQADRYTYEAQGWVYVPSGALWGLSDDPYLAFNIDYTCKDNPVGGGATTIASSGQAAAQAAEVLGLAATGQSGKILLTLSLAVVLLMAGLKLRKTS